MCNQSEPPAVSAPKALRQRPRLFIINILFACTKPGTHAGGHHQKQCPWCTFEHVGADWKEARCERGLVPDSPSSALWNLQTRFTQAVDKMLDILGVIPLGVLPARHRSKIGTEGKQVLHRFVRGLALTELSKRGSQCCMGLKEARHITLRVLSQRKAPRARNYTSDISCRFSSFRENVVRNAAKFGEGADKVYSPNVTLALMPDVVEDGDRTAN